jgi:hypothetical protein
VPLPRLFDGLDDATAMPQTTFQVIHLLESFPFPRYGDDLLMALPSLAAHASWWSEVLVARALNSDEARIELRDIVEARSRHERERLC